jgi:hypothetical protein
MSRSGLIALLLLPVVAGPATAARTTELAIPTQQPDGTPQRPVGEPDAPPAMGLDFFDAGLHTEGGREEAWPWPLNPSNN